MPASLADRLLVHLRPGALTGAPLRAAESRARLRPLFDPPPTASPFAAAPAPTWYLAEPPDGAASGWDLAHGRVAALLGVAPADLLFAEPDLLHAIFPDDGDAAQPPPDAPSPLAAAPGAVGARCVPTAQDPRNGKAVGPGDLWHLGDAFSQLAAARAAVPFADPRTRVAHVDTGYYRAHATRPRFVRADLERNFVDRDGRPGSAEDPDHRALLLDSSGHGAGTLGILAGARGADLADDPGGAPGADVVPLRVADSVVLLRTSALARALAYAADAGCDVATVSMGGLPSGAWREAVDRAYLAGVCVVAAAGNNVAGAPTRFVVYPARYARVIAACGVMADGRPYAGLSGGALEGNAGPPRAMRHALAAYTPNIPWPVFGCPGTVRRNGEGTSSAAPQVAAAAALWLERYKHELPRDWRRVEAVRHALFTTAAPGDPARVGRGVLRARDALAVRPDLLRPQTPSDDDSFAFLRVLTGLGVAASGAYGAYGADAPEHAARARMFALELEQRWLGNPALQALAPDPDDPGPFPADRLARFVEAVVEDDGASDALRRHAAARYPLLTGRSAPRTPASADVVPEVLPACEGDAEPRDPPYRRLRVYATDPSFSARLDTAATNEVALRVRWEPLAPGPVGEYLAVVDEDPSGRRYAPVDLDEPRLLAQDGWAPSEGNPQFHQQMAYAVAMRTVEHFERALGRPVLWRHRRNPARADDDGRFVRRLTVRPHALRQANAYYSPDEVALLFGYFEAGADAPGDVPPGARVYACLSHDIVAHETTHAVLDGMYRRFNEPTNPDVLALHEAFADVVALLQHFAIPEALEREIARARGDVEAESALGSLAVQFGRASGGRGALREAIGRLDGDRWTRLAPDPAALARAATPHARGAVLVAAVFDAFVAIYKTRTADLLRLATGGTGVLPPGAIPADLVRRLADEAARTARHVLGMCIRAVDYLPPVDVTFFEYLRALITADGDFVGDDRYNYRLAFVEAFRRRGILPLDGDAVPSPTARTLSVDTLRWQGLDVAALAGGGDLTRHYGAVVDGLKRYADACLYLRDRRALFAETRAQRRRLHAQLARAFRRAPAFAAELGLEPGRSFEVHELRRAMRQTADGRPAPQVILALTQSTVMPADPGTGTPAHPFRGGVTLVVDLSAPAVAYRIVKHMASARRRARAAAYARRAAADPLTALLFAPGRREPFAALHALAEHGGKRRGRVTKLAPAAGLPVPLPMPTESAEPGAAFPAAAFRRSDESPDPAFYAAPRFVTHIDAAAIAAVTALYREYLPAGGAVLDLMSSWVSHLPDDVAYARVAGLGMNAEELAANPRLTDWRVQDLNADPRLPYGDAEFDGAGCCVSVQYLTRPERVFQEVARVLRPGAPFVVTFSNRCFPTKAVAAWQALDDAGHARLVAAYFAAAGGFGPAAAHAHRPRRGDPLWGVVARRV